MIPLLAVVRVDGPVRFRLWLPLFLVWILLLPFVLILLPFALLLFAARGATMWLVLRGVFEVLSGMRGTHVEVCAPGNSVFVHVW
jgi:hypothetical protein